MKIQDEPIEIIRSKKNLLYLLRILSFFIAFQSSTIDGPKILSINY